MYQPFCATNKGDHRPMQPRPRAWILGMALLTLCLGLAANARAAETDTGSDAMAEDAGAMPPEGIPPPPTEIPPPPPAMPPPPPTAYPPPVGAPPMLLAKPLPRNTLEIDPTSPFLGYLSLRYERVLSRYIALDFNPVVGNPLFLADLLMVGGSVQMRWYFAGTGPRGWYATPQVQTIWFRLNDGDSVDHVLFASTRLLIGYHWVVADGPSVSLGLGAQYLVAGFNSDSSHFGDWRRGVWLPATELSIGIPF